MKTTSSEEIANAINDIPVCENVKASIRKLIRSLGFKVKEPQVVEVGNVVRDKGGYTFLVRAYDGNRSGTRKLLIMNLNDKNYKSVSIPTCHLNNPRLYTIIADSLKDYYLKKWLKSQRFLY